MFAINIERSNSNFSQTGGDFKKMQWDWEKCNKSVQSVESVQRVKSVQGIEKLDEHIETFTKLKIRDRAIRCEDVYQNMSNRNCILLKDLIGRRKLEELDKVGNYGQIYVYGVNGCRWNGL